MEEYPCLFCKIIHGELLGSIVFKDEICTAFLDIFPINPGHVLVVPNRHVERSYDLSSDEAERIFRVAQEIYRAIRKTSLKCEGATLFLSDGAVAGQEISHSHFHISPRFAGDNLPLGFSRSAPAQVLKETLDGVAAEIRTNLGF
jgi:histidine triad (HIT) family protein